MSGVNLLPWRHWQAQKQQRRFGAVLGVGIGVAGVLLSIQFWLLQDQRSEWLSALDGLETSTSQELDGGGQEDQGAQWRRRHRQSWMALAEVRESLQVLTSVQVHWQEWAVDSRGESLQATPLTAAHRYVVSVNGVARSGKAVESALKEWQAQPGGELLGWHEGEPVRSGRRAFTMNGVWRSKVDGR